MLIKLSNMMHLLKYQINFDIMCKCVCVRLLATKFTLAITINELAYKFHYLQH